MRILSAQASRKAMCARGKAAAKASRVAAGFSVLAFGTP